MTVTIDWPSGVITIPQAQLTHISGANYELDVDELRLALKDLEDGEEGQVWPDTHRHATAATLSGVTYARQVEILDPYTITFEDVGAPYTVSCVGANHNIGDVKNVNQVSLIIGNSAGLIVVTSGSGVTEQDKLDIAALVWDELVADHNDSGSMAEYVDLLKKITANKVTKSGDVIKVYEDNGTDVWRQYNLANGGRVLV